MASHSLDLDRVVKWAIVSLCAVLIADVAMRHVRDARAASPERPFGRSQPAPRPEPPVPSEPVSLDESAFKGEPDAPLTILAYSDFQCPYCQVFARDILPKLDAELLQDGRARLVLKHLPLDSIHPQARRLAAAAECARQQNRFWEFHDAVFARQRELAALDVLQLTAEVGLAAAQVSACLSSGIADAAVRRDSQQASQLGVTGTPTFFVGRVNEDGRLVVSRRLVGAQPVDAFRAVLAEVAGAGQ